MIKCQFALLARGVIRDHETNAISIYNVIEQFQFPSFPVFFPEVMYYAALIRDPAIDPAEFESIIRFKIDGATVLQSEMKSNFQDKIGNRLILRIGGLPIPNPGTLTIELLRKDNDELLHLYEIKVVTMGMPPKVEAQIDPVGA